jgi:CrcB protein
MLKDLAYIAVGGGLGALVRYGIGIAAVRWLGTGFPYGILAVNVGGCFLIGLLAGAVERRETQVSVALESAKNDAQLATVIHADPLIRFVRLGLMVGFLGGLTTFSSFGLDTLKLVELHRFDLALGNVALNVLLSLAAVWLGLSAFRAWQ